MERAMVHSYILPDGQIRIEEKKRPNYIFNLIILLFTLI